MKAHESRDYVPSLKRNPLTTMTRQCALTHFATRAPILSLSTLADRIDFRHASAWDTLVRAHEEGRSFDLIYVDADKRMCVAYYDYVCRERDCLVNACVCSQNAPCETGLLGKHAFSEQRSGH